MFKDIGKFVGRYFQGLACVSIASMLSEPIFFDAMHIDFSFLFLLLAAEYLIKHHPTARKWTIGACGFILVSLAGMFIYAATAGTQRMFVLVGKRIEHPSLLQVAAVTSLLGLVFGLPLILLLTPQARKEFQREIRS
jgi:membrane associated rhomboid family serine protease